ncbi:hypothetical protein [Thiomicrospira sp. S5]|uniref:hypothetical protein n=1 Tax=Thiomicrospira sp. S5 TaxID=1803865 RepID=UPI0004A76798|nr:hypothetical protein [Thiomicrospira sp. S5]AZR82083.1 hypothetical protein AYJ59_07140 [Thiomicrospira sp. S5]
MNKNPILIVFLIFLMSLTSSIILFNWLENSANLKLPIGEFEGALAGFIGVFYMLERSFQKLSKQKKYPVLNLPTDYLSFISEDYGISFGFPKNYKIESIFDIKVIGTIKIDDKRSNINIVHEFMNNELVQNKSETEIIKHVVDQSEKIISEIGVIGNVIRKPYSLSGLKGGWQQYKITSQHENLIQTQVIIPNFKTKSIWYFTLTSLEKDLNRDIEVFENVLSTVSFS